MSGKLELVIGTSLFLPQYIFTITITPNKFFFFGFVCSFGPAYYRSTPRDNETKRFLTSAPQIPIWKTRFCCQEMSMAQLPFDYGTRKMYFIMLWWLGKRICSSLWSKDIFPITRYRITWNLACSKCHGKDQDKDEMISSSISLTEAQSYSKTKRNRQ